MSNNSADIQRLLDQIVSGSPKESAAAKELIINQEERAVPILLKLMTNADDRELWAILSLLSKVGDERAVPAVIECLKSENRAIQGVAAQCLGNLADVNAIAPIVDMIRNEPESDITVWLVQTLGKIGDPIATDVLVDLVNTTKSAALRYTAIEALGLIGDERAMPTIMNYVADENRQVRSRATAAMGLFRALQTAVQTVSVV